MKVRRSRISAFLIDILFVIILTTLTANVYQVNPYLYDTDQAYKEYNEIYNDTLDEIDVDNPKIPTELKNAMYKYDKTNTYLYLWYIVFGILYFVIFQWLNKGQTLGKKLFKIRVVNEKEDNPNILQYLIRFLINGTTLIMGVNLIVLIKVIVLLVGCSGSMYYDIHMILQSSALIIEFILVISLLIHKNNKMFNDFVARTKVIEVS